MNGTRSSHGCIVFLHFVVFRLCPSGCDSCSYNYGEYIIDMDTYLEATLDFMQEKQERYCQSCNECYEKQANGEMDDDGYAAQCGSVDTSSCYDECQNIENMEANGYLDASEFTGCVELGEIQNDDDAEPQRFFAGAMCASSGSRIKIGVFADEECSQYVEDGDVETYMNMFANNNNNNNNNGNNGEFIVADVVFCRFFLELHDF